MKHRHLNKGELLRILASETCPVCQHEKAPFTWACDPCYWPHMKTPEHVALNDLCDAHLAAADAFLTLARSREYFSDGQ